MTCNVAAIISVNSFNAWLIEVSELMIELEIYWPYPMVYKSSGSAWDHSVDSNFFSRSFRESFKASSTGSAPDELNPLSSEYVVLYTAPRDLVAKTLWWTSFPKTEASIHNDRKSRSVIELASEQKCLY